MLDCLEFFNDSTAVIVKSTIIQQMVIHVYVHYCMCGAYILTSHYYQLLCRHV